MDFRRRRHLGEALIHGFLLLSTALSALAALGIVVLLAVESFGFFSRVSLLEFITDTRWSPLFQDQHFGILPLASASLMVATGAALVALPHRAGDEGYQVHEPATAYLATQTLQDVVLLAPGKPVPPGSTVG